MNLSFIPKLQSALTTLIDRVSKTATIKSPEASAVIKAEALQSKLSRLDSMPNAADRAKVVADAGVLLGSTRPANFSHAVAINGTISEALAHVTAELKTGTGTSPVSGAEGAGQAPHGIVQEAIAQILDATATAPKTLAQAHEMMKTAHAAAMQMANIDLGDAFSSNGRAPALPATDSLAAAAQQKFSKVEAMFTAAGLNLNQALVGDTNFLKRKLDLAAVKPADLERIRVAAIELPPTDEEVFQVYENLRTSGQAERRTKFFAQHEHTITSVARRKDREAADARRAAHEATERERQKANETAHAARQNKIAETTARLRALNGHA